MKWGTCNSAERLICWFLSMNVILLCDSVSLIEKNHEKYLYFFKKKKKRKKSMKMLKTDEWINELISDLKSYLVTVASVDSSF